MPQAKQKQVQPRDPRTRILLVDDDDSVLEAVATILRGRNHHVRSARDVQEAQALLEKEDFDLVIADVHVSDGSNGIGLSEWLAQNRPSLSRNLIWMCAAAPSGGEDKKTAANGRPILHKPFQASDLLGEVDHLLLNKAHAATID